MTKPRSKTAIVAVPGFCLMEVEFTLGKEITVTTAKLVNPATLLDLIEEGKLPTIEHIKAAITKHIHDEAEKWYRDSADTHYSHREG